VSGVGDTLAVAEEVGRGAGFEAQADTSGTVSRHATSDGVMARYLVVDPSVVGSTAADACRVRSTTHPMRAILGYLKAQRSAVAMASSSGIGRTGK